ncbi:MAG: hypothetical protein R3D32_12885 [Nitratireductor sp.]
MSKIDKGAMFGLGLVAGVAISLALLVWASPWFTYPPNGTSYISQLQALVAEQQAGKAGDHFWIGLIPGWLYSEDSLAQWIMAVFGIAATVLSAVAVVLVKKTLDATREGVSETRRIGQAQTRAYLFSDKASYAIRKENIQFVIEIRNTGNSPATEITTSLRIGDRNSKYKDKWIDVGTVNVSSISSNSTGISLFIIDKNHNSFNFLSKKTGIIDIDCVISWDDVFGEKYQQSFIFGYYARLSEGIFGSKPFKKVELAGYQDTRYKR